MISYKIVKYCRMCKKRFLVNKGENKIRYCSDCQAKADEIQAKKADEENKGKEEVED